MARPKSSDGKSTLLAFKISASQQAAYDAARGALPMADWARIALDRAAGIPAPVISVVAREGIPPGMAALVTPGQEPVILTGLSAAPPAKGAKGNFACCGHCPSSCGGNHTVACRRCA